MSMEPHRGTAHSSSAGAGQGRGPAWGEAGRPGAPRSSARASAGLYGLEGLLRVLGERPTTAPGVIAKASSLRSAPPGLPLRLEVTPNGSSRRRVTGQMQTDGQTDTLLKRPKEPQGNPEPKPVRKEGQRNKKRKKGKRGQKIKPIEMSQAISSMERTLRACTNCCKHHHFKSFLIKQFEAV